MSWIVEEIYPLDQRLADTKDVIVKVYDIIHGLDGAIRHIDNSLAPCIHHIQSYIVLFQQLEKEYSWDEIVYPCIKECLDLLKRLKKISLSISKMDMDDNTELILGWDKEKEYSYPIIKACKIISNNTLDEHVSAIADSFPKDVYDNVTHRLKIESEYYKVSIKDKYQEISQYLPYVENVINGILHDIRSVVNMKPGDLYEERLFLKLKDILEVLEIFFPILIDPIKEHKIRSVDDNAICFMKKYLVPKIEESIQLLKNGRTEI